MKLEEQIKREKDASKEWKTQVKKLETNLVNLGSKPNEKKSNKNSYRKGINLLKVFKRS